VSLVSPILKTAWTMFGQLWMPWAPSVQLCSEWGYPRGRISSCRSSVPRPRATSAPKLQRGFGDPWNNLVTGNPWTLYWIPFVRGGVAGIDQRSRYIETLADIERTSLDY